MKQGLTIAEGFFYKPVAYYEFVHCGSCSLTSKRNTQQQKHGFTEKPEHGWNTFSDLEFQVFSKTRSNSAASHFSAVWGCECIMWSSEHQEPQKCLAKPSSEHEMPCPQWKQVQLLLSWCNSTIHTLCELATLSSTRSFMYWWTEISTAIEMLWSRDGSQSTFHWIKPRSSTTQTKGLRHEEYSKGICQLYLQSVPQVLHWFLIPITGSILNCWKHWKPS